MKLKIVYSLLCSLWLSVAAYSQPASLRIDSDIEKGTITINNTSFNVKSTLEAYEKVLGKANRIEKIAGKDKFFAYDSLGISLSLKTNTNLVQEIYISYFDDSDKRTARGIFAGTLLLNGHLIHTADNHEKIMQQAGIEQVIDMDSMYAGKNKKQSFMLMLYYPESTLGQLGFSFQ